MPTNKQPIDLVMIKGKKHLTKSEINERKTTEIRAPSDKVAPPPYLNAAQKKKFASMAVELVGLDIFGNLDCDTLARYLQSEEKYLKYDRIVNAMLKKAPKIEDKIKFADELIKFENLRDKALKQCRCGATDLGLTITSRCRLVVPKAPEDRRKNKFEKFADQ